VGGSGCVAAGRKILVSLERARKDGHFGAKMVWFGWLLSEIWAIERWCEKMIFFFGKKNVEMAEGDAQGCVGGSGSGWVVVLKRGDWGGHFETKNHRYRSIIERDMIDWKTVFIKNDFFFGKTMWRWQWTNSSGRVAVAAWQCLVSLERARKGGHFGAKIVGIEAVLSELRLPVPTCSSIVIIIFFSLCHYAIKKTPIMY
jgi:hypothetical protein